MAPIPRTTVVAICGLLVAIGIASPLHLPLNNPNEGVRVFSARALVEHGTLAIDPVIAAWGYIDDKATKDGRTYQSKAPLPALLGAAVYALVRPLTGELSRPALTRVCRAAVAVPAAAMLWLCWTSLRARSRHAQGDASDAFDASDGDDARADDELAWIDLVMVGLVLGTGVLASLHVVSGHALAALAPAAILAVSRRRSVTIVHHAAVGIVFAVAVSSEYPAILCAPLVLLVSRRARRPLVAFAISVVAGLVTLLPTLVAHQRMWGAWWKTGYSFLENPHYRPLVEGTLFGVGWPDPRVWLTVLVSPELGLWFFSPFLLLGLGGFVSPRRGGRFETIVVVVVVVSFLLFIAGFRGWRGGWSVGPRYILELAGILAVFVVDGLRFLPTRWRWPLLASSVMVSVLHAGLAGAFFPHLPDVLRAPVGELVLPLVWRGFSPESLPLLVGASTQTASVIVAAAVLLPPLFVVVWARRVGAAVLAALVAALVAFIDVSTVSDAASAGREVRRVVDNWRPEAGIPWIADAERSPLAVAVAVDRVRTQPGPWRCDEPPRPRRTDVGPGASALRTVVDAASPGELVVVDEALADHIGPTGGTALVVTVSDLGDRALPCRGVVHLLMRGNVPTRLRALIEAHPPQTLGDGFIWRRLRRPVEGAP
jgi:hypothetical protein